MLSVLRIFEKQYQTGMASKLQEPYLQALLKMNYQLSQ
jgi:hypothetical protein